MKFWFACLAGMVTAGVGLSVLVLLGPSSERGAEATHVESVEVISRLPVAFVPNLGQWEHTADYVAQFGPMNVFLEDNGWTFTLLDRTGSEEEENARGVAVRMTFEGAEAPQLDPESRLSGVHHYFLGSDSKNLSDGGGQSFIAAFLPQQGEVV